MKKTANPAVRQRLSAAKAKRLWSPLALPLWGVALGAIAFPVLFSIEPRIVLPLLPLDLFDDLTISDAYVLLALVGATYGFVAVMGTKFLRSLKRPSPHKEATESHCAPRGASNSK